MLKDLPNPIIIDGANKPEFGRYKAYLAGRGCKWEDIPERSEEGFGGGAKIYLPEETTFIRETIREGYDKYTIIFPDGGWIIWCDLYMVGTREHKSRIVISRGSYEAVKQLAPF